MRKAPHESSAVSAYLRARAGKSSKSGTFRMGKIIPLATNDGSETTGTRCMPSSFHQQHETGESHVYRTWWSANPDPDPVAAGRYLAAVQTTRAQLSCPTRLRRADGSKGFSIRGTPFRCGGTA